MKNSAIKKTRYIESNAVQSLLSAKHGINFSVMIFTVLFCILTNSQQLNTWS